MKGHPSIRGLITLIYFVRSLPPRRQSGAPADARCAALHTRCWRRPEFMRMSTCTRCLWLQIIVVTVQLLMLARQAALWQSDLPRAMWSNHSSAPRPAGESEGIAPPPPPSPPPEAGAADGITGQTHVPPIAAEPAAGEPGQAPPLVLFAAGVQGSGHEPLSELLIRLPQAKPSQPNPARTSRLSPRNSPRPSPRPSPTPNPTPKRAPTTELSRNSYGTHDPSTSATKATSTGPTSTGLADGADGGAGLSQPVVGGRARGRTAVGARGLRRLGGPGSGSGQAAGGLR